LSPQLADYMRSDLDLISSCGYILQGSILYTRNTYNSMSQFKKINKLEFLKILSGIYIVEVIASP
jgi:hypothetical protein